ncbi:MAG: hypothetical protein A2W09_00640 [Deltaproteobacteria bacterium RBG_16_50_11]|nr:MAG: hypothetical protein A2W09_00640 [Deltaproteobacteria bacterium RBG_16_50_11]
MGIRPKWRWGIVPIAGILVGIGFLAYCESQQEISERKSRWERVFSYTGTRFGIPVLKASIQIENGFSEQGKPLYRIRAAINSLDYFGLFFRMNNRFLSTVEVETFVPIQYVKEIDQDGLLVKKKHYLQTIIFDHSSKKIFVEKSDKKEKEEFPLSFETYDPLSMFARHYLREEIYPGRDIHMSIFDGLKLRQMVFHSKKEEVESKIYGKVEAICIESTTSFSNFGEQEGTIRIWYSADRKKIPLSMELGLPMGDIHFELDEMKER